MLLVVGERDSASLRTVAERPEFDTVRLPSRPERAALDAALDSRGDRRLAVAADDAGLGIVVRRLLHRDELSGTPIGILGAFGVRARYGLPGDIDDAAREVLRGSPAPVGLVRDDHSGVALCAAQLLPISAEVGVRAFVEDHELIRRRVSAFTVIPGDGELIARAELRGRLHRDRVRAGRAVTVSCEEARLVIDGAEQPRHETRRTWWYEPDRWLIYR